MQTLCKQSCSIVIFFKIGTLKLFMSSFNIICLIMHNFLYSNFLYSISNTRIYIYIRVYMKF